MGYPLKINKRIDCYFFLFNSQWLTTILVIHLVHEWNIVIYDYNMTIFHEWTK